MPFPITAGALHIGEAAPLVGGKVLAHTFSFLHHRTSETYFLVWAESTREGPSRILVSTSSRLFDGWTDPRTMYEVDGPVDALQLASSGGTEIPRLYVTFQPMVGPGIRVPMHFFESDDGARTWDGPHLIRYDEPRAMGGQVPPLDPPGGPGTEHLLSTFVPGHHHGPEGIPRPDAWALVATDRFLEWSLGIRPWQPTSDSPDSYGSLWGTTTYLGLRHHMPLQAYMAEDKDGSLCLIYLKTPTDYATDAERPPFPQAHAVRLDLESIMKDHDKDGEQDLEDFLLTRYHSEDLYRLWLQCRVDGKEMGKRPFISGVRKVLNLKKGLILQSPRPYLRAGQGVPRTLLLAGRGVSKQVSLTDVASSKAPKPMQDRGKDRYPDSQGFQIAPGDIPAEEIKPGMVLVSPGWGVPTRRFVADLEVPPTVEALPEKALFHFWSHNFLGAIVRTDPPDAGTEESISCRITVELDEEVVLEDGLQFPILSIDNAPTPDRSPEIVGFDDTPAPSYKLVALGKVASIPSTQRRIMSTGIV